jgi:acyl-coenzyme A thioesterase 9
LAYMTAYMYIKEVPEFISMDEITFVKPVQVGDFLQMVAHVVYSNGPYVHVDVNAFVIDPATSETKTANIFSVKFKGSKDVIPVFPETYEESMRFLHARRHHLADLTDNTE